MEKRSSPTALLQLSAQLSVRIRGTVHVDVEVAGLERFHLIRVEFRSAGCLVHVTVFSEWDDHRPVLPAAPMWMCAAVPCMPLVMTLPDTEPSSPTEILPSPLADVVTGGTSFAPESSASHRRRMLYHCLK